MPAGSGPHSCPGTGFRDVATYLCVADNHKDIRILSSRTCEYVTLQGKRDTVDEIKDCEMGRLFWFIQVGIMYSQGSVYKSSRKR